MSDDILKEMGFETKENGPEQQAQMQTPQPANNTPGDKAVSSESCLHVDNNVPIQTSRPSSVNNRAEQTLSFIATLILILGLFSTAVMLFTICYIENPEHYGEYYHDADKYIFSSEGIAITCITLVSTVVTWASMKVLANISMTLKDIKDRMQ